MSNNVILYFSSAPGKQEIRKRQIKIKQILDIKKIDYKVKDLSSDPELVPKMYELMEGKKDSPPQIFNGDQYCGNFEQFEEAIEEEALESFLKLEECQS